jgi:predicted Zn-dependent protease with MMP-like domain
LETKAIFVGFTVPPSIEDIDGIANAILDELPDSLRKRTATLKIQVEDFPDDFIQEEMELETGFDLLGCYQSSGVPVIGHLANGRRQDVLFLYRRPILDMWADNNEDLTRLVNRVIIHEIGTHFGFSADEIEMYEEDMFGATASGLGAG